MHHLFEKDLIAPDDSLSKIKVLRKDQINTVQLVDQEQWIHLSLSLQDHKEEK